MVDVSAAERAAGQMSAAGLAAAADGFAASGVACMRDVIPPAAVARCLLDVERCFGLLEQKLKAEHGVELYDVTSDFDFEEVR
jgi:hypothetical protein